MFRENVRTGFKDLEALVAIIIIEAKKNSVEKDLYSSENRIELEKREKS